jgi:hypothetical protein
MLEASPVHQILDTARWAPSGDNTQPWRFEILDEARFVIHGFDTREHCVYDLDGQPSQMALGALIETISIAASTFGLTANVVRRTESADTQPTFDVTLLSDPSVRISELFSSIPARSVQRRAFSPRRLSVEQKSALEQALDPGYRILWLEGAGPKWQTARLMFANAKLRLTTEEAYRVHSDIIHWGRRFSPDRVPDQALGVDALTLKLMQWLMKDWARVRFFNRFLAGTWAPRIQMDFLPSLLCGAHFVLLRKNAAASIDDHVDAGRMVQRLWLTATSMGLMHQPELTPLIFARYVRNGVAFSTSAAAASLAVSLAERTRRLIGPDLDCAAWIGRIGTAPSAMSRSLRRPLSSLTVERDHPSPLASQTQARRPAPR